MTSHADKTDVAGPRKALSIGFIGILGAGNIGNDASFESVLGYLRTAHPDARIDAMCTGPDRVRAVYGIEATPLSRPLTKNNGSHPVAAKLPQSRVAKMLRVGSKIPRVGLETALTGLRVASWVRGHDVVIVPGMGVLEATLRVNSWSTPYWMFVLSLSGRLFGTKVALVSVGANPIRQRLTRLLYASAARLAFYRSYRDEFSRDVMRRQGIDVTADHVYPDLAFGLSPLNDAAAGDPRTVGIGLMEFYGNNDDRAAADRLHEAYGNNLKLLARRLLDSGHSLRFFIGDISGNDSVVLDEILTDLRSWRPDLEPTRVVAEPTESFTDLMAAMAPCGSVVAARFHNVLCALNLAKPTIATGYAAKHSILMASMGMDAYCMDIRQLDVDLIVKQLDELQVRSAEVRKTLRERRAAHAQGVAEQFAELSKVFLG